MSQKVLQTSKKRRLQNVHRRQALKTNGARVVAPQSCSTKPAPSTRWGGNRLIAGQESRQQASMDSTFPCIRLGRIQLVCTLTVGDHVLVGPWILPLIFPRIHLCIFIHTGGVRNDHPPVKSAGSRVLQ